MRKIYAQILIWPLLIIFHILSPIAFLWLWYVALVELIAEDAGSTDYQTWFTEWTSKR